MLRNYLLGNQVIFDTLKREVISPEQIISLGGRESAILKLLCENANVVISKEDIQDKVWGKVLVSETSLTKAISNLRKSLQMLEGVMCEIKTIPKEGYMLILEDENLGLMVTEDAPPLEVKRIESKDVAMIKQPISHSKPMVQREPVNMVDPKWYIIGVFSAALLSSMISAILVTLIK
ncbi:winged helix-turn-helix domain-containing protein [Vibrio parahaemolyticus]|uniref:winged helix-turn-helix domain-containing protein n=1 Tax=Vibrio parahaemolyticus TaxID=670 RepID=UPI00079FE40C|nr:winged helix-turn-helix domain-containing protein [Vibrio parahaemolyticus]EGQ7740986.1 transcriptional regulator [Vibrio parahaemolyticus]EGR1145697.1 transcriptional regulator [Vibrio parahaemolyticus]EJG1399067.1 winged helix-turn-helix domain-containing protein [Vibrio parahaemolyticus]ELU1680156.1 winged helix-turn-helix domain-containing protein [Vibrio parahaemolyticus]KYX60784.1 transcriptional regulator [Vibrio parahaemolyticus]